MLATERLISEPDEGRSDEDGADRARLLAVAALAGAKRLAEAIDPDTAENLVLGIENEIASRILSMTTVVLARARGLLKDGPATIATWSDLDSVLRPLARRGRLPFRGPTEGPLFDRLATRAMRADDAMLAAVFGPIASAATEPLDVEALGSVYEELISWRLAKTDGGFTLGPSDARRKAGAHFTSQALTGPIVERTLGPLVGRDPLDSKVCDPAMGSGAFLVQACRFLAARLIERSPHTSESRARRRVAERCISGVDLDPRAVDLARMSLWLLVSDVAVLPAFADRALQRGDALVGARMLRPGATSKKAEDRFLIEEYPALEAKIHDGSLLPLHWPIVFPDVMKRGGFDAIVGNPPWVSYAGRAAQPIEPAIRAYYGGTYAAFAGYRNLQALFVERALTLLRPGGRLGFVVPTSMSDLGGYEPSRRAHDQLAICDSELPDLEDGGFAGVFQPCMALFSTRRRDLYPVEKAGVWPLARHDLDPPSRALLAELGALPTLPPHLFGERGFQSTSEDVRRFTETSAAPSTTPLRTGSDVAPFARKPPSLYCDPALLGGRFRKAEGWSEVAILIRQTARYPMATRSDGSPFRNSILAGFADATFDAALLVAYLNSSPVRWYHYMRHRDARQGMPQLKIAHLRALPSPPEGHPGLADLRAMGDRLDRSNRGISESEQAALDELVSDLLGLSAEAREVVDTWRKNQSVKTPKA